MLGREMRVVWEITALEGFLLGVRNAVNLIKGPPGGRINPDQGGNILRWDQITARIYDGI